MRIEGKITGGHCFLDVVVGEVFLCKGTVYMRVSMIGTDKFLAVNLETGVICALFPDTAVTPRKAKVVME